MSRFMKAVMVLVVCIIVSAASVSSVQASPATLTVLVDIDDQKVFWDCTYLTKEGVLGKPASIQVAWETGDVAVKAKTETVMTPGKAKGKLAIVTEKGAVVNMRVSVRDAKNIQLGYINLQVVNKGQSELVTFAPPESIEPIVNYGGKQVIE